MKYLRKVLYYKRLGKKVDDIREGLNVQVFTEITDEMKLKWAVRLIMIDVASGKLKRYQKLGRYRRRIPRITWNNSVAEVLGERELTLETGKRNDK